ncbi:MAG: SDR family NAD(P)-dependent oxidoreductase [Promethearchaeota archaeon]
MTKQIGPILITGAGSGIGKTTTHYLSQRGFQVYATDSNEEALNDFSSNEKVHSIRMDVTKKDDIKNTLATVMEDNLGLYGLINSAGIIRLGPVMEAPDEELELQFNVNVFGMYQVTKAFYPLLSKSKGRIINISSAAGRFVSPFYGFYSMSKMAVEAFSDALRRELMPMGIKVSIIQPGLINTAFWDKAYLDSSRYKDSIFKERLDKFVEFSVYNEIPKALQPERIAKAIHHALTSSRPKSRYFVTKGKYKQIFAEKLPTGWIDYIISRI